MRRKQKREVSPYLLELADGTMIDCSSNRSYASMVNHVGRGRNNAKLEGFRMPERGQLNDRGGVLRRHPPRLQLPARLRHLAKTVPTCLLGGVKHQNAWLVARKAIHKGAPIFIDYASDAKDLMRIRHTTTPPLC